MEKRYLKEPIVYVYSDGDKAEYTKIAKTEYARPSNIALVLLTEREDESLNLVVSVNIGRLGENELTVDINSFVVKGVLPSLVEGENSILKETERTIPSGYVVYPVFKLNIEKFEELKRVRDWED